MSHDATYWAFKQRGLTPSQRVVLYALADRHNPDNGCFPSQERIAEDTEQSLRTVQDCLNFLEREGYLRRIRVNGDSGYRIGTRYILRFEDAYTQDVHVGLPAKSSETYRQILRPNLVKDKQVKVIDGAPDLFETDQTGTRSEFPVKSDADAFDIFWKHYPRKTGKENARKSFSKALDRKNGVTFGKIHSGLMQQVEIWGLLKTDLNYIPHAATWLNQSRFNDDLTQEIENAKRVANHSGHNANSRQGPTDALRAFHEGIG